jgi:hypothetical protein
MCSADPLFSTATPRFWLAIARLTNSEPYQRDRASFGFGGDALARKTGVTPYQPPIPGLHSRLPYVDHFHVIVARHSETTDRKVFVSNEDSISSGISRNHHGAHPARPRPSPMAMSGISIQRLDGGDLGARQTPFGRATSLVRVRSPPSSVCAIRLRCADVTPPVTKPSWILVYIGSTTGRPTAP